MKRRGREGPRTTPVATPGAATAAGLDEVWEEAARLYSNRRGMRPRGRWWFGIGERAYPDRYDLVTTRKPARRVADSLRSLSDRELRVFAARAVVNLEQAVAATRLSLIVNVTVPVGLLVLIDGFLPEGLFGGLELDVLMRARLILGAVVGGAVLLVMIWYAYAGAHQARDLHHLAVLEMARRGLGNAIAADLDPTETKV